jgi:transposase
MPGCENTVIEGVDWHQEDTGDSAGERQLTVTVHVRPRRRLAGRCGICGRRRPGYDKGEGRRRRRALDPGTVRAELEAAAPRVACPEHGAVAAAVPRARHGAGPHPVLRRPGRLAGRGVLEDHDHRLDADLLADRGHHHRPGVRRG